MLMWVLYVALFLVILRTGLFFIRAFAQPVPAPPPAGEMRRVNLRFRCSVCGAEVRMTTAPEQEPEAPRHCLEDMDLVAPID